MAWYNGRQRNKKDWNGLEELPSLTDDSGDIGSNDHVADPTPYMCRLQLPYLQGGIGPSRMGSRETLDKRLGEVGMGRIPREKDSTHTHDLSEPITTQQKLHTE